VAEAILRGLLQDEGEGYILEWKQIADSAEDTKVIEWLQRVVDEYSWVFGATGILPPSKRHNHAIVLKVDSQIPNGQYKYPHYQKT